MSLPKPQSGGLNKPSVFRDSHAAPLGLKKNLDGRPLINPSLRDCTAPGRAELARARAREARRALADCRLCACNCGADRRQGRRGACQAGPVARVFSAQVEVSDELELAPVFAIALSGCHLRCEFCITRAESWNAARGMEACPRQLAARAEQALRQGARTIMLLGGEPTIHLPTALEIVAALPDNARLAWKTNACASAQARAWLAGLFEVWVADFKFGNDQCAARLAGGTIRNREPGIQAPGFAYVRVVQENLLWAGAHTELIVRHLLMPGHLECCWRPVAAWLAAELPEVKVNLRSGFWPARQPARNPELRRTVSPAETAMAHAIAREHRLNLIT